MNKKTSGFILFLLIMAILLMINFITHRKNQKGTEKLKMDSLDYKINNAEESLFEKTIKKSKLATIYLINGIRLEGIIRDFDQYSVLLENSQGNRERNHETICLVSKHAIATIITSEDE